MTVCKLCHEEFDGCRGARYCPSCKTVTCPICGKRFEPSPARFTRYVKRGFLTCGSEKCKTEIKKRNAAKRKALSKKESSSNFASNLTISFNENTALKRKANSMKLFI